MSGLTTKYRELTANDGAAVRVMDDERLLAEFTDTHLMLATDDSMPTNALRIGLANDAFWLMRAEILRRMDGRPL